MAQASASRRGAGTARGLSEGSGLGFEAANVQAVQGDVPSILLGKDAAGDFHRFYNKGKILTPSAPAARAGDGGLKHS
ncbi:hypothetical protein [Cohnella nanjingensis]|uniref:Uncharacterized protein n=1 Tax=Cohnella nanjingensis TaxID=1387779 RepID=A0A7X0RNK3_9BACL|nr:hypothetical protein [Cohnella nanjingensis]MBB6670573.1 hypothetical protein [Cohnella nanjingensis]